MLDWNTLPQSHFMGSWCLSNVAPSTWWHTPKPQKQILEKFQAKKDQVTAHSTAEPNEINHMRVANPDPDLQTEAAWDETEM